MVNVRAPIIHYRPGNRALNPIVGLQLDLGIEDQEASRQSPLERLLVADQFLRDDRLGEPKSRQRRLQVVTPAADAVAQRHLGRPAGQKQIEIALHHWPRSRGGSRALPHRRSQRRRIQNHSDRKSVPYPRPQSDIGRPFDRRSQRSTLAVYRPTDESSLRRIGLCCSSGLLITVESECDKTPGRTGRPNCPRSSKHHHPPGPHPS
jgi:hypothetical protein